MTSQALFKATAQAALLGAASNVLAQLITASRNKVRGLTTSSCAVADAAGLDGAVHRLDPRVPVPLVQHHQHAPQLSLVSRMPPTLARRLMP